MAPAKERTTKASRLHGFRDIFSPEAEKLRLVENTVKETFELFGFSEVIIPVLELSGVYFTGLGDTTDIVQKEMYSFETKGGECVSMRPEGTAGVARAFIENSLHRKSPVTKLYYSGEMFRYEKPQEGRQRSFNQIGAELFGSSCPESDSEVVEMLWLAVQRLGLSEHVKLEINSIGEPPERELYKNAIKEYFLHRKESLCQNCEKRLKINPLRILDCKEKICSGITSGIPFSISEYLSARSKDHLDCVLDSLTRKSIPFSLNTKIVRGLDYYTDTVFEITTDKLGAQNAVAAGGRYDLLVERMGGPNTPAVGFAIGVERIILLQQRIGTKKNRPGKKRSVHIIHIGEKARAEAARLASILRRNGIRTETEYESKSLRSQMRKADKTGADYSIVVGDDELGKGVLSVRNMKTGEEKNLPLEKLGALNGMKDFQKIV